ncbi:MAG: alpha/beta hydrolase [Methylophilaceae bacterium]|nr:alpha/beta hydrolase [Methyloradius sp.]
MRIPETIKLLLIAITVVGCAANGPEQRREQSTKMAIDAGWQRVTLNTDSFYLATFVPHALQHAETLTIYIEGDGMAWVDRATPSFDPTPRDPLALRLALSDPSKNAVYLARPCQYVTGADKQNCTQKYWTDSRFAPEVISASNQAISQLKSRYQAKHIRLVGYSGGAAVAVLVAAQRDDIEMLVTVAGNLDTAFWTKANHLSPLTGSLNPADTWQSLQAIEQRHYVGGQDKVIAESIARAYADRFDSEHQPPITVIADFDHHCCWVKRWPEIVKSNFSDAH